MTHFLKTLKILLGVFLLLRWLDLIFNFDRKSTAMLFCQWRVFLIAAILIPLLALLQHLVRKKLHSLAVEAIGWSCFVIFFHLIGTPSPLLTALAFMPMFILNTLPRRAERYIFDSPIKKAVAALLMLFSFPIPELICPVLLARAGSGLTGIKPLRRWSPRLARIIALGFMLPAHVAVATFWTLRTPPSVESFGIASHEYYGVKAAPESGWLFAANSSLSSIDRFNLDDPHSPPARLMLPGADVRYFDYDRKDHTLAFFDMMSYRLFIIDAASMKIIRSFAYEKTKEAAGHAFPVVDPFSDNVCISFEEGDFWLVSRQNGAVIMSYPLLGNAMEGTALDPETRLLYLSYTRKQRHVYIFDLMIPGPAGLLPLPATASQIALYKRGNALLVAIPVQSKVLSYRLSDYALQRSYRTVFGVRGLATDELHGLLFAAGLTNAALQAIDLQSGNELARWRVGVWPRYLAVDPPRRKVYVSTGRNGLWQVDYSRLCAPADDPSAVGGEPGN